MLPLYALQQSDVALSDIAWNFTCQSSIWSDDSALSLQKLLDGEILWWLMWCKKQLSLLKITLEKQNDYSYLDSADINWQNWEHFTHTVIRWWLQLFQSWLLLILHGEITPHFVGMFLALQTKTQIFITKWTTTISIPVHCIQLIFTIWFLWWLGTLGRYSFCILIISVFHLNDFGKRKTTDIYCVCTVSHNQVW